MARSVAASNNRPNYIYTSSLSPSLSIPRRITRDVLLEWLRENVRDHEGETKNKSEKEKGRKRKESEERKDAENKEKEKIETKRWVARPIRGLSIYNIYMMKGRDQSFDIIVRQRVMEAYLPYRGEKAQDGYASDEIYSLHILRAIMDRSGIVNHSISIACYW